jgi:hypothetical protein
MIATGSNCYPCLPEKREYLTYAEKRLPDEAAYFLKQKKMKKNKRQGSQDCDKVSRGGHESTTQVMFQNTNTHKVHPPKPIYYVLFFFTPHKHTHSKSHKAKDGFAGQTAPH